MLMSLWHCQISSVWNIPHLVCIVYLVMVSDYTESDFLINMFHKVCSDWILVLSTKSFLCTLVAFLFYFLSLSICIKCLYCLAVWSLAKIYKKCFLIYPSLLFVSYYSDLNESFILLVAYNATLASEYSLIS